MLINSDFSQILLASNLGWEFEFYSKYSVEETAKHISRLLNKQISVETQSHSDFVPSADHYKIEPDMSGGKKLMELVTGALPYQDARIEFIKILNWIAENGHTTEKCGMHINVSFDDYKTSPIFLSHMNVLKFVLEFNEDVIYQVFPNRKGSVYAKSIKYIVPKNKYYFSNIENVNPYNFITPDTKYFGVNFLKLQKNYLEFRYLGGEDYDKRITDLLRIIDHFIISLHNSASDRTFTDKNYRQLSNLLNKYQYKIEAYKSLEKFRQNFPNIDLMIDLRTNDELLKSYWSVLQEKLFVLLNECNIEDGKINYDSDIGKLQIKDCDLRGALNIDEVDLFSCKVKGVLNKCDMFDCEVSDSEIYDCNIFNGCNVTGSKVIDTYVDKSSTLVKCYFDGKKAVMNGTMEGGILRNGLITANSQFDNEVEKIDYSKIKTNSHE